MPIQKAKFSIGDIVKHKHFDFRGVIYDVDFEFNNSEEWYQSIPKNVRPRKDQPFYHLLAENDDVTYEAYVSQQNFCQYMNLSAGCVFHDLSSDKLLPSICLICLAISIMVNFLSLSLKALISLITSFGTSGL